MSNDHAFLLAKGARVSLVAAAGCGKTELIARAVASQDQGRQLILTHTHAGVKAIRDRLRKLSVSPRYFVVDTIAGWALKYAASFPHLSGLTTLLPKGTEWGEVYQAALKLLDNSSVIRVIRSSYDGLYVDEYQDCILPQHEIILSLAKLLPCRVVGDPLQGVFEFEGTLIDWSNHVVPNFEALPQENKPWRWLNSNPKLGEWLLRLRDTLLSGKPIDLYSGPLKWMKATPQNQRSACFALANKTTESIVAIEKWPQGAHKIASTLNGSYVSMEEMECKDLLHWCNRIDSSSGSDRAVVVLDFSAKCFTKVSTEFKTLRTKFDSHNDNLSGLKKHKSLAQSLLTISQSQSTSLIADALRAIEAIQGAVLYRRELWNEMKNAIAKCPNGGLLKESAWQLRNQRSTTGRPVGKRVVSRTLLIKGLEFDHAIVLNADSLKPKELYVAMTRGSKSLTVLSSTPLLECPVPT
jgi:DNA helicase-2/ATP-dependent DNA helicase PcrA